MTNDPDIEFMRAIMDERGWTTYDVGAKIGASHATIGRWLRGVSVPRPSSRLKIRRLAQLRSRKPRQERTETYIDPNPIQKLLGWELKGYDYVLIVTPSDSSIEERMTIRPELITNMEREIRRNPR